MAFERFKMILKKDLKDQVVNEDQMSTLNKNKAQENIFNLMHFIQRQKMKDVFEQLNKKKSQVNHASKASFTLLHGYEQKKMKEYFKTFMEKATIVSQGKTYLLNFMASAITSCQRQKMLSSFRKIEFCAVNRTK